MVRRTLANPAAVALALCVLGVGVDLARAQPAPVPAAAMRRIENYAFDPATALVARIRPAPNMVLAHLRDLDKKPEYAAYTPTPAELAQCERYLAELPPVHRAVLRERLIGVYFVTGFQSSGLSDYVWGPDGGLYTILVLNPDALRRTLSDWLTFRENTCFVQKPGGVSVQVDGGTQFTGLMYTLLHEATHIVDYVRQCTPYVEPDLRKVEGFREGGRAFVKGVWDDYRQPAAPCDFPLRKSVTLYGLGGGPKIALADAPAAYRQMAGSPFVSLYGSSSWAEDLA